VEPAESGPILGPAGKRVNAKSLNIYELFSAQPYGSKISNIQDFEHENFPTTQSFVLSRRACSLRMERNNFVELQRATAGLAIPRDDPPPSRLERFLHFVR
jgi:hypothetical protein